MTSHFAQEETCGILRPYFASFSAFFDAYAIKGLTSLPVLGRTHSATVDGHFLTDTRRAGGPPDSRRDAGATRSLD